MIDSKEQKKLVAKFAVDNLIEKKFIFSGMKIGLGTGSTAIQAVFHLANRIKEKAVSNVKIVSTSFQTTVACQNLGLEVYSINSPQINGKLDLTIDGADEIDPKLNLIKGGGAALLLEKIIAYNSSRYAIIADESKFVETLGTKFPLPVEIIPEARVPVVNYLNSIGVSAVLREGVKKAGPVVTDNGNLILDALWKIAPNCNQMEEDLNKIVGVVENGFFTQKKPIVFKCNSEGTVSIFE